MDTSHAKARADIEIVCQTVHGALRAFAAAIGQDPAPEWAQAPDWMKDGTRRSVLSVLDAPEQSSGAQHQQWMDGKLADGWAFGPTKDDAAKTHPMMVPYEQLPLEEKRKDTLLIHVVKAFLEQEDAD